MPKFICKLCSAPCGLGRRLCSKCNIKRVAQYKRYTWTKNCIACESVYEAHRKDQLLCKACFEYKRTIKGDLLANNNYVFLTRTSKHLHRKIASDKIGRKLDTDEVVHHLDENFINNDENNLIIMSRRNHARLHAYLDNQRVILQKSKKDYIENSWDAMRLQITAEWLEKYSVKAIKLSEIQPLEQDSYEQCF